MDIMIVCFVMNTRYLCWTANYEYYESECQKTVVHCDTFRTIASTLSIRSGTNPAWLVLNTWGA